jgi:ribosome-associated heat shock protein Hsp15
MPSLRWPGCCLETRHPVRIDKLLWFLRLSKSRGTAQELATAGHIRINGRRAMRAAQDAKPGDILVIPLECGVRVIELLALPVRRGPPAEAQACYRTLDGDAGNPIAAEQINPPEGTIEP